MDVSIAAIQPDLARYQCNARYSRWVSVWYRYNPARQDTAVRGMDECKLVMLEGDSRAIVSKKGRKDVNF